MRMSAKTYSLTMSHIVETPDDGVVERWECCIRGMSYTKAQIIATENVKGFAIPYNYDIVCEEDGVVVAEGTIYECV